MENCHRLNTNFHLEFIKGSNVSYVRQLDENENKFVAFSSDSPGYIPLVRMQDINRYYINPSPDFRVVNALSELLERDTIIAPAIYQPYRFSISEHRLVIDNNCLAIQIKEISPEYLLSIINSALFAFYNLSSEENETEKIVLQFPFAAETYNVTGIKALVWSIVWLQRNQSSRDSRIMTAYFMNVLDAAIFEIYFPAIFREYGLNVLSELSQLSPFENDEEQVNNYYKLLNDPQSAVRKAIYTINTVPEFKLIYQSLTNEN